MLFGLPKKLVVFGGVCLGSILAACSNNTELLLDSPPSLPNALIYQIPTALPNNLDQYSMNLLQRAERNALNHGASGESIIWTNGATHGAVTVSKYFRVGTIDCRRILHQVINGGESYEASATACHNQTGEWKLVQ